MFMAFNLEGYCYFILLQVSAPSIYFNHTFIPDNWRFTTQSWIVLKSVTEYGFKFGFNF
jgi:hypothetical protein